MGEGIECAVCGASRFCVLYKTLDRRFTVVACEQMVPSTLPMKQSTVLADYTAAGPGVLSLKVSLPLLFRDERLRKPLLRDITRDK